MHIDLTPHRLNKFLGLAVATGVVLALAPLAAAQSSDLSQYQGPGILSPGVGDIGMRSGQQVDLRYYVGASGIYDSNPQPVAVDANGNLLKAPSLYGAELDFGAYGSHNFRRAQLSLDYRGNYLHYTVPGYDTSDHALNLGYTYQASRRLVFDLREAVGTIKYGYGTVWAGATGDQTAALNSSSLFFDTRTYYAQSTAAMTFLQSAKTSYTMSGTGFIQDYTTGTGLSNAWGYTFSGSVNRRLTKSVTIGALYQHSHFESPGFGVQSTSNAYYGTFASALGQFWTLNLQGGVSDVQVESPFTITLSPLMAAILGQNTLTGAAFSHIIYPSGSADLRRQFQHASLTFHYDRQISAGNGLFSTSRVEDAMAIVSYTGLRKISLSISGGYNSMVALDQTGYRFSQGNGGAGMTYDLGHNVHLSARYDFRDQQIIGANYALRGSRVTVGLLFSPGNVPLSLW